jgi:hypothetical protein
MVLKEYHGKVFPNSRDNFCYLFDDFFNILSIVKPNLRNRSF